MFKKKTCLAFSFKIFFDSLALMQCFLCLVTIIFVLATGNDKFPATI